MLEKNYEIIFAFLKTADSSPISAPRVVTELKRDSSKGINFLRKGKRCEEQFNFCHSSM